MAAGRHTSSWQAALDATASPAEAIWLGVWEHNPRAIAIYLQRGFADLRGRVFQLGDDP
jgi:ribosomal protein S18 acetylase RimI-like enzyme